MYLQSTYPKDPNLIPFVLTFLETIILTFEEFRQFYKYHYYQNSNADAEHYETVKTQNLIPSKRN